MILKRIVQQKLESGQHWEIYIPEEGDWRIAHTEQASKKEAMESYLKWAGRKTLPKGSFIHPVDNY